MIWGDAGNLGGTLSAAIDACNTLLGVAGGSPRSIASTNCIPDMTRPKTVYLLSRLKRGWKQMKNWLFAESGSVARAIETVPRK